MRTFKNYITEYVEPFEDYSDVLMVSNSSKYNKIFEYLDCKNNCIIVEGSFQRLIDTLDKKEFAIITAYRAKYTKRENIERNRKLRTILNSNHMGVIQLVGHWLENQNPNKRYDDADKSDLIDSVERSYLIEKPESMTFDEFKSILQKCMVIDGDEQDSIIICKDHSIYIMNNSKDDYKLDKLGDTVTYNKISQAYSQYVKKMDVPFVFEGIEMPDTNYGKMRFSKLGYTYIITESAAEVIDQQWINDDKPVKTKSGHSAIITNIDMGEVPNIIKGQVKVNGKLIDFEWYDTGECKSASDMYGNPRKPESGDTLCKKFS